MVHENYSSNESVKTLKDLIKRAGLTARKLAQKLGIDESHITRYSKGDYYPSLPVFAQMCKELNASPLEVLNALGLDVTQGNES